MTTNKLQDFRLCLANIVDTVSTLYMFENKGSAYLVRPKMATDENKKRIFKQIFVVIIQLPDGLALSFLFEIRT